MRGFAVSLFVVGLASASLARAEAPPPRPRVSLALSGGGARGIAHIGVLRAFEEAGIPIDGIVGTSMGAVVGSLYASGYRSQELETLFRQMDWQTVSAGRSDRRRRPLAYRDDDAPALIGLGLDRGRIRLPSAALSEYGINRFLIRHLSAAGYAAEGDFHKLKIPFEAVATALDDGERIVLSKGSLPLAVRASMSVPVAFPPVSWNGRPLVDGGLVDNLPVRAARDLGGDVVVAVDVQTLPFEPSQYQDVVGIANQVTNVLSRAHNRENAAPADVVVAPDLGRHLNTDYGDLDGLIRRGYEAGLRALPALRERLAAALSAGALRALPASAPARGPRLEGTPILEVQIVGNQAFDQRLLRRVFNIPLHRAFDLRRALMALDKLQAASWFDWLWMDLEPVEGLEGLRVVLRVREGAPTRVEAGAGFNEPERAKGFVRVRNRNLFGFGEQLDLTVQGSDALSGVRASLQSERLGTPWLGYRVSAYALDDKPRFFEQGRELNRARFNRDGVAALLRRSLKRSTLFEAGLLLGQVETRARAGLGFLDGSDSVRSLVVSFTYDSLDDLNGPDTGARVALRGEKSPRGLGASYDYSRGSLQARLTQRLGERTRLQLDLLGGLSSGALPPYEKFRLGGPALLPGYHAGELWGAQAGAAGLSARVRLFGKLRGVARAGTGNVWDNTRDIRLSGLARGFGVGLVHPSRIGPVGADFGIRDGGSTLLSISIGYPFGTLVDAGR